MLILAPCTGRDPLLAVAANQQQIFERRKGADHSMQGGGGGGRNEEIELSLWTEISQYQRVAQKILTATVRRLPKTNNSSLLLESGKNHGAAREVIKFQLSTTTTTNSLLRRSTHFHSEVNPSSSSSSSDLVTIRAADKLKEKDEEEEGEGEGEEKTTKSVVVENVELMTEPQEIELDDGAKKSSSSSGEIVERTIKSPIGKESEAVTTSKRSTTTTTTIFATTTSNNKQHKSKRNLLQSYSNTRPFKGSRQAALRFERSLRRWIIMLSSASHIDSQVILSSSSKSKEHQLIGLKSYSELTNRSSSSTIMSSMTKTETKTVTTIGERLKFTAMISYSHGEAKEYALSLKGQLEAMGVSCYLDLDEILLGSDWEDSLNEAVTGCEAFVALITPSYGSTLWTSRELKLADLLGKHIIPVNFDQTNWPPAPLAIQCATMQYVQWSSPSQATNSIQLQNKNPSSSSSSFELASAWHRDSTAFHVAKQIKLSIERMRARRELISNSLLKQQNSNEHQMDNICRHERIQTMSLQMRRRRLHNLALDEQQENLTTRQITSDLSESASSSLDEAEAGEKFRMFPSRKQRKYNWLQLKVPAQNSSTSTNSNEEEEEEAGCSAGSSGSSDSAFSLSSLSYNGGIKSVNSVIGPVKEAKVEETEQRKECWCKWKGKKSCKLLLNTTNTSDTDAKRPRWHSATRKAFNKLKKNLTWSRPNTPTDNHHLN